MFSITLNDENTQRSSYYVGVLGSKYIIVYNKHCKLYYMPTILLQPLKRTNNYYIACILYIRRYVFTHYNILYKRSAYKFCLKTEVE